MKKLITKLKKSIDLRSKEEVKENLLIKAAIQSGYDPPELNVGDLIIIKYGQPLAIDVGRWGPTEIIEGHKWLVTSVVPIMGGEEQYYISTRLKYNWIYCFKNLNNLEEFECEVLPEYTLIKNNETIRTLYE